MTWCNLDKGVCVWGGEEVSVAVSNLTANQSPPPHLSQQVNGAETHQARSSDAYRRTADIKTVQWTSDNTFRVSLVNMHT